MSTHVLPDGSILDSGGDLPPLDDILTAKELADFFGTTERSLGAWRIPHVSIGVRRFYFKATVVAWMKAKEGR